MLRRHAWVWGGLLLLVPAQAQVQADGSTATLVARQADGHHSITPAMPERDVSYNAFSRFDVGAAGASFANVGVGARTIVAEVFSPLPSRIEGPVRVDGPRANLILANQNGLRVNGGSFINFGSLALTTGAVTLRDEALAPDVYQRYVDLRTQGGSIQIEAGGLDANLIRLELIARQVGIHGPVTNAFTSASASTRVIAGASSASFDTLASPTDNLTPWLSYKSLGERGDGIAIDVTANSSVRSGRVELVVTDAGAGVRNAGALSASAGDFRLTSSGLIEQIAGRIEAAGDVRLQGREFVQSNGDGGSSSSVVAGGSARIDTEGSIRNLGGTIQGQTRSASDADTPYAVLLNAGTTVEVATPVGAVGALVFGAADDVVIRGEQGVKISNARIVSNGSLRLRSAQHVEVESVHLAGRERLDWSSSNLLSSRNGFEVDRGSLADPAQQSYLVAGGELSIEAGSLRNSGGYLFSNAGAVRIDVQHDLTNQALSTGHFGVQNHCVLFWCKRSANASEQLSGGQINAATTIHIKAGGTVLNDGGQFLSVLGTTIEAPQTIARARPVQRALVRADGLKALFGDTWARLYASDQGGGFTAQQGRLIVHGAARQEGGYFAAGDGVEADIEVEREPQSEPVRLDQHLGILRW